MKSQELRIGNLISRGGNQVTVGWGTLKAIADGRDDVGSPITITEEALQKNGFIQIEESSQVAMYKNNFGIEKNGDDWNWQYRISRIEHGQRVTAFYSHPLSIKYVHQLQNLYFALTGLELIQ